MFYSWIVPGSRDQRTANVAYYRRNRELEIPRVRARQAVRLALLRALRMVPCSDCGRTFAPYQMDYDHRDPWTKSFRLTSGAALGASMERLLAELAKCDVVCAVCHRIRTLAQHRERLRLRTSVGTSRRLDERRRRWTEHGRLLDQLRDRPCVDCGGRFPPCAMDFDHLDADRKRIGVTRL